MSETLRPPCTCTTTRHPCLACLAWRRATATARTPGALPVPPGLAEAHRPGSPAPLLLPLHLLEVVWIAL